MNYGIRLLIAGVVFSFLHTSIAKTTLAQVVHLPTIQTTYYSGSVLVPDSGSGYLGGSASNRTYSSQFGRPRSRMLGRQSNAGNTSVTSHIIDLDAIDREIRGLPPTKSSSTTKPKNTQRRSSMNSTSMAVADIYTRPSAEEVIPRRRRTLKDFTPGDYMMLLSHPNVVKHAHETAKQELIQPTEPAIVADKKPSGKKAPGKPTTSASPNKR